MFFFEFLVHLQVNQYPFQNKTAVTETTQKLVVSICYTIEFVLQLLSSFTMWITYLFFKKLLLVNLESIFIIIEP